MVSICVETPRQARSIQNATVELPRKTGKTRRIHHPQKNCIKSSDTRGRVALFIDEANLFNAARMLGIQINYARLLSYLMADNQCSGAFLYTAVKSNRHKQQLQTQTSLQNYQIIDRPMIRRQNGTVKANLDVEIALDLVMKGFENVYDTAILVSGDGDFTHAVNLVKQQGRRVEVISLKAMTSKKLVAAADAYLDLASIQQNICQ